MKKPDSVPSEERVLGRRLAKELTKEELERAAGGAGRITYSGGRPGDWAQVF